MFLLILQTIESEDDRAFLEQLFDAQYVRLCKKAGAITHNNQVSEDLVQDVFLYVVKHIQKFRQMDCCTLRHILDISIKRRCYDYFKKQNVRKKHLSGSLDDDDSFISVSSTNANTEEVALNNLTVEELAEAIRKLPDHYRYAIEAKYILNLTDGEIAKELGIRKASVRQYLTRARRKIYELCEGESNEE